MPSVENTQSSGASTGVAVTITGHVVTAADIDVVTIAIGDPTLADRTVATVVRNAQSYSLVTAEDDGNFERVEIWKRDAPSAGTFNCVITFGGDVQQCAAGATGFTGASTTLGTPSVNTATSTNPTVTVVDSASGDLVVSVTATDGSASTTTEGGTLLWEAEDVAGDSDFNAQYQTASGASTVCAWTNATSAAWAAAGVAVKASGGGGPTPAQLIPAFTQNGGGYGVVYV